MTIQISPEKDNLLTAAESRLRRLSVNRLRVANDFLAYLEERESQEATEELLSIPGFEDTFNKAVVQVKEGATIPFSTIKKDV